MKSETLSSALRMGGETIAAPKASGAHIPPAVQSRRPYFAASSAKKRQTSGYNRSGGYTHSEGFPFS